MFVPPKELGESARTYGLKVVFGGVRGGGGAVCGAWRGEKEQTVCKTTSSGRKVWVDGGAQLFHREGTLAVCPAHVDQVNTGT